MFSTKVLLYLWAYINVVNAVPLNLTECRENSWPYDLHTPFPYRTLEPIDVDTSSAKLVNLSTPLKYVAGAFESFTVTNTGYTVAVSENQPGLTTLTGGPLGKDVYVFHVNQYFWSGTYTGSASNRIDGLCAPLQVRPIFRNTKYGTFQNAILHRDGLVVFVVDVQVEGYLPNPLFTAFAGTLKSIIKAGSSVQSNTISMTSWADPFPLTRYYYAYPGAYIDFENGHTQYDCATIIVPPKGYQPAISIPQFQNFLNLLNYKGTPITNSVSARPSNGRPIVQVCSYSEAIYPTNV